MWPEILMVVIGSYAFMKYREQADQEDPRWLPAPVYDFVDDVERVAWDE